MPPKGPDWTFGNFYAVRVASRLLLLTNFRRLKPAGGSTVNFKSRTCSCLSRHSGNGNRIGTSAALFSASTRFSPRTSDMYGAGFPRRPPPDALPQTLGVLCGSDRSLDYSFPPQAVRPPSRTACSFLFSLRRGIMSPSMGARTCLVSTLVESESATWPRPSN